MQRYDYFTDNDKVAVVYYLNYCKNYISCRELIEYIKNENN